MAFSLTSLAQASQWTVDFNNEQDILIIVPATRETGLFANRMFFRLMNLPEGVKAHVVFYETTYKAFRSNELGYEEEDYLYGSRAYTLAKKLASDKIKTYVGGETDSYSIKSIINTIMTREDSIGNVLCYGLSSSNYQTHFYDILESITDANKLGVYLNGTVDKGLSCHLINEREDAIGITNRPFDDSLQTQLTISTTMFNVLNKWISGTNLGNKTVDINLATGEMNPRVASVNE